MDRDELRLAVKEAMDAKMEDLKAVVKSAAKEAFAEIKPPRITSEAIRPGLSEEYMEKVYAMLCCVPWPPCYAAMNYLGPEIFSGMEIADKSVNGMLKAVSERLGEPEDQLVIKVFREVLAQLLAPAIYELWKDADEPSLE